MDFPQLSEENLRISRALIRGLRVATFCLCLVEVLGCSGDPASPTVKHYDFPKGVAFLNEPKRLYDKLGVVRTKVNFQSLDVNHDEDMLCRNYYNKAVSDLVKRSRAHGGDAVIDVQSVVFLDDGHVERYKTPECSDDGYEGQILAQGIAIRWKKLEPQASSKNSCPRN